MYILYLLTFSAIIISYISDRKKTIAGIQAGLKMFLGIIPTLFVLILLISILVYLLPDGVIVRYLGKEAGFSAYVLAALIGSVALIPSFIAYPLAGILLKNGVSYQVIAVFMSTLLMVGVLSIPLEARYYGWQTAIIRNLLYFAGAVITGTIIGLIM